jgi:hypothetical protein
VGEHTSWCAVLAFVVAVVNLEVAAQGSNFAREVGCQEPRVCRLSEHFVSHRPFDFIH